MKKKRLFGILLSLALMLTMMSALSMTVHAEDAEEPVIVTNADEFRNALRDQSSIIVEADFELPLNNDVIFNNHTTLDLNGHTITAIDNKGNNSCIATQGGREITIKDSRDGGKITIPTRMGINGFSSLTLEGGTLEFTGNDGIDVFAGSLTMTGGMINSNGSSIYRNEDRFNFDIDISGGTIKGEFKDLDSELVGKSISGGRFSFDPTDMLSDGFFASKEGEYWVVSGSYPLWVDGTQVTGKNKDNVLEGDPINDGKVSFTPAFGDKPAVLTLNGALITTPYVDKDNALGGIYSELDQDLNIVVESDSSVNVKDAKYGIYAKGGLMIKGEAALDVRGESGIRSNGNLTFYESTVTAKGSSCGIYAVGDVDIKGTDSVITAESTTDGGSAITSETSLTINNLSVAEPVDGEIGKDPASTIADYPSVLDESGKLAQKAVIEYVVNYPVWVSDVRVTSHNMDNVLKGDPINDGKVSYAPKRGDTPAALTLNGAVIKGKGKLGKTSNTANIHSETNDLTVVLTGANIVGDKADPATDAIETDDCKLTIDGSGSLTVHGTNSAIYTAGVGNYGQLEIKGGLVKATSDESHAISATGGVSITGGSVQATTDAEDYFGVFVNGKLTVGDKVTSFIAVGNAGAIQPNAYLKNAIAGTGWTDKDGTQGRTDLEVSEGQRLGEYKKIQFPAAPVIYTVTFVDGLGKTLKEDRVEAGKAATAPANPKRSGYTFAGWDTDFSNVRSDLIVKANWNQIIVTHTVTFEDGMGNVLSTQSVRDGRSATAPAAPVRDDYIFSGWDRDFSVITRDMTVKALWTEIPPEERTYNVVFVFNHGIDSVVRNVQYGESAEAPAAPKLYNYEFDSWDKDFTNVTENMTVNAIWKSRHAEEEHTVTFLGGYMPDEHNPAYNKTVRVKDGQGANAPDPLPTRVGYTFIGWDTDFSYVTTDMNVIAQWEQDTPPTPAPTPKPTPTPAPTDTTPIGSVHNVSGSSYVVTSANTVSLTKAKSRKSFTVPAAVNISGKTFNVTGMNAKAFKGTKVKTLTVRTKGLTKKSVKGSLKGSKVKTVKVKVGKKKINKKYVKKYKKIFTKKNAGRKVKVK